MTWSARMWEWECRSELWYWWKVYSQLTVGEQGAGLVVGG